MRRFLLAGLALANLAANAQVTTFADFMPKEAYAGETVVQTFCSNQSVRSVEAQRGADSLVMRMEMGDGFSLSPSHCTLKFALFDGVAPGTYQVAREGWGWSTFRSVTGSVRVLPAGAAAPAHTNLSGNWFDPAAPGRGLNIVQGASGKLLVVWLDHGLTFRDFSGLPSTPNWFVIPSGQWIAANKFRGILYRSFGSPAAVEWSAANARSEPLGLGTLTFASSTEVTFQVEFMTTTDFASGGGHTATLKRFSF